MQLNDERNLDEIPAGMDPLAFAQLQAGENPVIQYEEDKPVKVPEDDAFLMTEAKFIPHENDTEDLIPAAEEESGYNRHHSHLWNQVVNNKA